MKSFESHLENLMKKFPYKFETRSANREVAEFIYEMLKFELGEGNKKEVV